jgi:hypothetical protein
VTTTTYLGSGDPSKHRQDYRPGWLDDLADDVTIEGSMLTGIGEWPEAMRTILGFARTLYDYQEFNYVGPYGDHGFVEEYTSVVRGEADPRRCGDPLQRGEPSRPNRPQPPAAALGAVWSKLMGGYFAGTQYARYFLGQGEAEALHGATS